MIDKKSRRVVIINNIQSDTIDQAIFILKSDKSDNNSKESNPNIAREAQMIIDNYIHQVERLKNQSPDNKHTRRRKRIRFRLKPLFLTFITLASLLLIVFFMSR